MKLKRPTKKTLRPSADTLQSDEPSPSAVTADISRSRFGKVLKIKPKILSLIAVGCIAAIILIYNIAEGNLTPAVKAPTYTTVLPQDKSINELGGWKRVSPPKKEPVFAFTDTIDNVPISVSQQPLPESFKNDVSGQVSELAQKFNATEKLDASGTTVYVGTSFKGPQSVIFTKNKVLVLIKSEKKIQDISWINYVQSLN